MGMLAVVGVLCFLWFRPDQWTFRRMLPSSAREIRDQQWREWLLPDYQYLLKARITAAEFNDYVKQLGLTPHTSARRYSGETVWLRWDAAPPESGHWWNPTESLDGTFVHQEGDTWTFAKWEGGFVFLKSINH